MDYEKPKITIQTPNEIIDCGDYVKMVLRNNKNIDVAVTIFDKNKLDLVIKYKWYYDSRGYVIHRKNHKTIALHHLVFGKKVGLDVDHINGDKLDNRNNNLRYVTRKQGCRNRKCNGAYWNKINNKWIADIRFDGKTYYLGSYINRDDAIKVKRLAEKIIFGEYARNYNLN